MSSVAAVIKVAESLIPLPPEAFPKNLSRTAREDSPETMFPILAYDGQNILPTPWGYRSYFATNEKLLQATVARLLTNVKCENIFWYQSVNLDNMLVALASDGIYITNTDIDTAWVKVVDLAAYDTDPLVRNQWTFCTINNYTFVYMQGIDGFYGFVDPARYAEAATPTIIAGATVSQVATNWNVGVLKYIPNFLNMSGQLGIFKAGNRLGFWDSDGSVSWSSASYVEDLLPSVTTLAGFSKFADVIGTITKIIQHGDGFIIYCTRSIVGVSNNVNEKSKFSGRSILSNTGVLFDRQIVSAQPDSLHYVLTSSGLYTITNFKPEPIATDIIDGLVEYNDYLTLDYVDGRYLFINTINGWQGAVLEFEGKTNTDFDGNEYLFPEVNYPNPEDASELVDSYLEGRNQAIQDAFDDYEPVDDPAHVAEASKALIPCYDILTFNSTWAETTFTENPTGTELLDSKIKLGITFLLEDIFTNPVVTVNSIALDNNMPGDFAGQEAFDTMQIGMTNFNLQVAYQNAWANANLDDIPVSKFTAGDPPDGWDGNPITVLWEQALIERFTLPNCVMLEDLAAKATECRLELYLTQDRLAEVLTYFDGEETFAAGTYAYFIPGTTLHPDVQAIFPNAPNLTIPKTYVIVPYSIELENEFKARWLVVTGGAYSGSIANGGEITEAAYVSFCVTNYASLCESPVLDIATLNTLGDALLVQAAIDSSLYSTPAAADCNIYWFAISGGLYWSGAYYELIDGASYVTPVGAGIGKWRKETSSDGWGPYLVGAGPSTGFYALGTNQVFDNWTEGEKAAITIDHTGESGYTLTGTLTHAFNLLPNIQDEIPIFQAEVSGYGYYPSGGFSFRKTHSRHSSTTCALPTAGWSVPALPSVDLSFPDFEVNSETIPPYRWEYPGSIPLPANYWLTKLGSASPLYPVFTKSLIYDTQLEKWGISNMSFKAICAVSPVNRTDKTIAPKHDYGMLAAVLNEDGSISTVAPKNTESEICYGKIGQYRLGKSKLAYLKCHFKEPFTGSIIVETSKDGRTVAIDLTKAADFTGVVSAKFPFTLVGDWFNIKVRGDFTLSHIECYIEGRSRR